MCKINELPLPALHLVLAFAAHERFRRWSPLGLETWKGERPPPGRSPAKTLENVPLVSRSAAETVQSDIFC